MSMRVPGTASNIFSEDDNKKLAKRIFKITSFSLNNSAIPGDKLEANVVLFTLARD